MTDSVRLATVADAIRQQRGKVVDLERWQIPKTAHLLRAPSAFVDDIVRELSDDGTRGDALPWQKTHRAFRLRQHELTVWAGANGSAKSTLLSEIMLSLACSGRRVVVVSLEMPSYRVAAKMVVQALANAHPARSRIERWADDLAENLSFLDLTGDIEPAEAVKLARYCAHELGTQHVLIDNLTKIVSVDNESAEQQRRFVAALHRCAIDTGMHIHLVAHTRKPSAAEEDKPPSRYEVAGSRTLVDQPDNVVMVWRARAKDQKRAEGNLSPIDDAEHPDLILRIEKQRHGRFEGAIRLWMDRRCFRFVPEHGNQAEPIWA